MFEEHPIFGILFWGGVAALFGFLIYIFVTSPNCKRGHYERVHHNAWTQMITTSIKPLIMIPIYHAAYDSTDFFCDEYCGKNDPAEVCHK